MRQPCQVHRGIFDPESVLETVQFGRPHVQRRLPTFEPGGDAGAGARLLPLGAAAGGLAASRAMAAPNAARGLMRAPLGSQVVELHEARSSSPESFPGCA